MDQHDEIATMPGGERHIRAPQIRHHGSVSWNQGTRLINQDIGSLGLSSYMTAGPKGAMWQLQDLSESIQWDQLGEEAIKVMHAPRMIGAVEMNQERYKVDSKHAK